MKRNHLIILSLLLVFGFTACQKSASTDEEAATESEAEAPPVTAVNSLSSEETSDGWILLFDGTSLDGWKRYNAEEIGPLWSVQDGTIVCSAEGLGEGAGEHGGSLMTTQQFSNFDLRFEWKISPGGNSGVLYHVIEKPEYEQDYHTGPEYQVMDDGGWEGDLTSAQLAGSNYDMFAADSTKKLMPVGEWNTGRIVYNNGHVEHWLNGQKVVEFEEGSPEFEEKYKNSKWVDYPGWNQFKTGAISLQDHGAAVYYRNIKIKEL